MSQQSLKTRIVDELEDIYNTPAGQSTEQFAEAVASAVVAWLENDVTVQPGSFRVAQTSQSITGEGRLMG
jgi:hypothetical protein